MNFEFATATRIVFGPGRIAELGDLARQLGGTALVVTGRSPARVEPVRERLSRAEVPMTIYSIDSEPTVQDVRIGVERARAAGCDLVIAIGGGAAIDCGKAISAMLANEGDVLDYLEVVGKGRALTRTARPFIAIPTTAGTGAEVTRNAVLGSPAHRVKASLRSELMLPRVALVDPELTLGLPREITATTGMDALTQLIEPYTCCRTNPLTDAICRTAIPKAARSLRRACEQGNDAAAREDMALASLFGGMALANSGLGAVHGFAAPIGGMFAAPHGGVCAALLPHVMAANVKALKQRFCESETLGRYDEIGVWLTGSEGATSVDAVQHVSRLAADRGIPGLRAYGIAESDFPAIVEKAAKASSMKANPLPLTDEELAGILSAAW